MLYKSTNGYCTCSKGTLMVQGDDCQFYLVEEHFFTKCDVLTLGATFFNTIGNYDVFLNTPCL